jgi:hypothetical protein
LLFLPLGVVGGVEFFQNLSLGTVLAISPHRILGNLLPLFGVNGTALLVSGAHGFLHLQLGCVGRVLLDLFRLVLEVFEGLEFVLVSCHFLVVKGKIIFLILV